MRRGRLDLSPTEAVAIAVALYGLAGTPLHADAASALRKLMAAMPEADAAIAGDLAGLTGSRPTPLVPRVVADALHARTVLRIDYADRHGVPTTRSIEPLGYIGDHEHWYLVAWCRLRQAVRAFRTDRIESLIATGEPAPPRRLAATDLPLVLGARTR
jgi:predicted DNA-binding transcriptional regulator YafY